MSKRTKKSTRMQNRIYMFRTMLALIVLVLFFAVGGGIIYVKNQTATQTFTSDFMKIQFDYPGSFSIKENLNDGILEKGDNSIEFSSYGSYYTTALDHVKSLVQLNKIRIKSLQQVQGPNSAAVLESYIDNKVERSYFFVKDYAVYYFSTDDPALFSDLDAIVKSFRILD